VADQQHGQRMDGLVHDRRHGARAEQDRHDEQQPALTGEPDAAAS
jgi:hypothetical protein